MKINKSSISLLGLMILPFFYSCKPTYSAVAFEEVTIPKAPDYSENQSWAVLPNSYPKELKAVVGNPKLIDGVDVFFLYPTLLTDTKEKAWNADIYKSEIRKQVLESTVQYQASAWTNSGRLFVPFYRQTHYRVFVPPFDQKGKPAWEISYKDIEAAFQYYLQYYNSGNGIIIASHSQGSMHAKRLLKDFFDSKPLQKQLVAAYLIGINVAPDEFDTILPMESPESTGGFVSWNTYKKNKLPKSFDKWYKGGVTTNPISWDTSIITDESQHKGVLYRDLKIYPQSLSIEKANGMLWSSVPKVPARFFLSFIKSYHFADINLFWKDISINSQLRAKTWLIQNTTANVE